MSDGSQTDNEKKCDNCIYFYGLGCNHPEVFGIVRISGFQLRRQLRVMPWYTCNRFTKGPYKVTEITRNPSPYAAERANKPGLIKSMISRLRT
jgi:hypothetical protein